MLFFCRITLFRPKITPFFHKISEIFVYMKKNQYLCRGKIEYIVCKINHK